MAWLGKKITELQNKPYEQRLRILRRTVIIAAVLLIGFWIITLQFRSAPTDQHKTSALDSIFQTLGNLKNLRYPTK